ncbi:hypothetical protein DUNSADRAFT_7457 [Dunaliella salina]|uniref:Encoded protein n=1 Tax=Dunaliella salina TaxID=3046 RepID=A0ABQ7GLJ1_DUNSA|nr:hypothetical protein DUNSADRAFT_7457 [Dunaliella salina]|eukprot:KAF5835422.1 hypothetical protein DUNSADRAFT_7457 [Dunaliella salina]
MPAVLLSFMHQAAAHPQPESTGQPKQQRRGASKAQVSDDSEDLDLGFLKAPTQAFPITQSNSQAHGGQASGGAGLVILPASQPQRRASVGLSTRPGCSDAEDLPGFQAIQQSPFMGPPDAAQLSPR